MHLVDNQTTMASSGVSSIVQEANGTPKPCSTPKPFIPVVKTNKIRICVFCGASPGEDPAHCESLHSMDRSVSAIIDAEQCRWLVILPK